MSINEVREKLHLLVDDIQDEYVLRGFYRSLMREQSDAAENKPEPDEKAKAPRRRKSN